MELSVVEFPPCLITTRPFVVQELRLLEYIVAEEQISISIDNIEQKGERVPKEITEWESPYTSGYLGFTTFHAVTVVEWLAIQILESKGMSSA